MRHTKHLDFTKCLCMSEIINFSCPLWGENNTPLSGRLHSALLKIHFSKKPNKIMKTQENASCNLQWLFRFAQTTICTCWDGTGRQWFGVGSRNVPGAVSVQDHYK